MINETWPLRPLGELFEIGAGKTMSAAARDGDDKTQFLRTSNVLWDEIDLTTVDEMAIPAGELQDKLLRPGDLLVCEGGEIGRAAVWNGETKVMSFQNHLHRLRQIDGQVDPRFYVYFLQSAFTQLGIFEGAGNKTTIPNLSRNRLAALNVPHPGIAEQQGIVCALSHIREAMKVHDRSLAVTQDLNRAAMRTLLTRGLRGESQKETEIGPVPESWSAEPLSALTNTVYRYPTYYNITYRSIGVAEIRGELLKDGGEIETDLSQFRFIDEETAARFPRVRLQAGDIVMSVRGTMGKIGIARDIHVGAVITANLIRLAPNIEKIHPEFLKYALISERFLDALNKASPQTTIKTITAPELKSLRLPTPPTLDEQSEIVAILDGIDRKIDLHKRKRLVLDKLFKSLLHKVMTGEVRVSDLDLSALDPPEVAEAAA